MKNKKCNNNSTNLENNHKKINSDEFDKFLRSLLNRNNSKFKYNKNKLFSNNKICLTLDDNNNNNKLNLKNFNKNTINYNKTRNKELLYSTFSKKHFLTLDKLIEKKNNYNNNIKIKNKFNSISNLYEKRKKFNKTSEIFYSNYNLLLIDKLNFIYNKDKIKNIKKNNMKKRNIEKVESKENINIFNNKNKSFYFKNNIGHDKNITANNNYGELIITNLEDNINIENKNKVNNILDKKYNDINNQNAIKIIKKNVDLNQISKKKYENLKIMQKKLNEGKNNNISNDISVYKIRNYSFPNELDITNANNMKGQKIVKNNKNINKINKSNETMNSNYIYNIIQNKYNLKYFYDKKQKINKNNYTENNNDLNNIENEVYKKNNNKNIKYIKKSNEELKHQSTYKIIKVSSFYFINKFNKFKLNDDIKFPTKTIFIFFMKIINVYKNLLLKEKKKEQLLFNEIIEKNKEIKNLKNTFLKIILFMEKWMKSINNLKDFNCKKILIEKQLIEENKYLRSLAISKSNIYSNFYSSDETSYEGMLCMMDKCLLNNNINLKNKINNYKNYTANNSPQITKREINNEELLFRNKKNKLIRNYYILKKNRKEFH